MGSYRIATDKEKAGKCCDEYDLLIGPDGFECTLTEPEDRVWYRDGKEVIRELNRLHGLVEKYRAKFGSIDDTLKD